MDADSRLVGWASVPACHPGSQVALGNPYIPQAALGTSALSSPTRDHL